jgi:hypothetical protein
MAVAAYADFPDVPLLPGTININLGPYEDGAEIFSYSPKASPTEGFNPEMHVDPLMTFGISFGQNSATPGWSCGMALRWIRHHIVNDVIVPLAPYLTNIPVVKVSQPYCLLRDKSVSD